MGHPSLPDFVQWDRGVVGDEHVVVYGWIPRPDGRRDFALIEFKRATGQPTWWLTSSAKYSKALHEWCGGKPEEHVDCVPFSEALLAIGQPEGAQ
jgi:hypothetical protein